MFSAVIRPPHSILFLIGDPKSFEPPEVVRGRAVFANRACVSMACLDPQDGSSRITLAPRRELAQRHPPDATAQITAPFGSVVLMTSHGQELARLPTSGPTARVSVWVNRPTEPDEIVIGVE